MPPGERREYAGNAPPTTLSSSIDNAALVIPITNGTGWPTGVVGPFFVVIDKGLTTEEKVKCSGRTANTLNVMSGGRGVDGTAASTHANGAAIEHVYTATDANESNQHYADPTLDHHTQYLTTGRHNLPALHPTTYLDMPGLLDAIWPAGAMVRTAGAVPTTETTAGRRDWLPCDGAAVSRTVYARLFAAISTTYGTGDGTATFNVPDTRGRVTVGAGTGTGLTARANGQTFGAETLALTTANMPAHAHTVNSHSHGAVTGLRDLNHWHGLGGHVHGTGDAGLHNHAVGGSKGFVIGFRSDAAANGHVSGGLERETWTDMQNDGNHNHGNTGGPTTNSDWEGGWNYTPNHNHDIPAEAPGTNSQGSGTAFSLLQPSLVVTDMIKS